MQYRQLGTAGVRVSAIGIGTNQFGGKVDQSGVDAIVGTALELGINLLDTADIYTGGRSEETLGVALQGRRHQFVLATKVVMATGPGTNERGASRYHIFQGIDASLRRLQTDHIDLYQLHSFDATTALDETMRALDDLVRAGKVRYIGASNFAAWQLATANTSAALRGWSPFVTVQNHYHMVERELEREVLGYCDASGVGILPYFPLAGGFLTGKYRRGEPAPAGTRGATSTYVQRYMTDANFDIVDQLTGWAAERGHTMGDLAHAWLLARPRIASVISGVTSVAQLRLNAAAADWALGGELADVEQILRGTP